MSTQVHQLLPREAFFLPAACLRHWLYIQTLLGRIRWLNTQVPKLLCFLFAYKAAERRVLQRLYFTKIESISLHLCQHLQRLLSACAAATENQHGTHFDRSHRLSPAPYGPALLGVIGSSFSTLCPSSLSPSASNFDWQRRRWKNSVR